MTLNILFLEKYLVNKGEKNTPGEIAYIWDAINVEYA